MRLQKDVAPTEKKISQEPILPTYFSARPESCNGSCVRKAVSATYSMEIPEKIPATTSQTNGTGQPAKRLA